LQYQVGNRNMHYRFSPDNAFKMILPLRRELACARGGKTLIRQPNRHKGGDRPDQA
jgi:hypothetical protein